LGDFFIDLFILQEVERTLNPSIPARSPAILPRCLSGASGAGRPAPFAKGRQFLCFPHLWLKSLYPFVSRKGGSFFVPPTCGIGTINSILQNTHYP